MEEHFGGAFMAQLSSDWGFWGAAMFAVVVFFLWLWVFEYLDPTL